MMGVPALFLVLINRYIMKWKRMNELKGACFYILVSLECISILREGRFSIKIDVSPLLRLWLIKF